MASDARYPIRVEGDLDPGLTRWLWLLKWILVIPHYIVLFFLWIAFFVLTVVAFVAILVTERYPRGIFDFNVGVIRWSWRVHFYSYGALATDRYPPFTLSADVDYPARLDVAYPQRLSRGLVLVKWWILAIPHYLVVSIFTSGGITFVQAGEPGSPLNGAPPEEWWSMSYGAGLIGLLVFFVAIALLFTGRYPRGIFALIVGLHRWALRVVAYATLMTDTYPPFRLEQGGREPAGPDQAASPESGSDTTPPAAPGADHSSA
ncbi:DUF4389 domain-containing protein [Salinactinospora qingdaonensis]|uniref:DUF4389 domain-containing protein n=1 Tax=Salinactinospora qingdaonensis TaxID=702744 RepID=A0ABP7GMH5_9ACTN